MNEQINDAGAWWEGRLPSDRAFLRDMIRMAQGLFDGEALQLKFTGGCLSLVMASTRRRSALEPGRTGGSVCDVAPEPEKWWAGLSPQEKRATRELANQLDDLVRHRDETLVILNTGGWVVGGRLSNAEITRLRDHGTTDQRTRGMDAD